MKKLLLVSFLLLASCSSPGVKLDAGVSALGGNDYTGLIKGCGNQLSDGFIVCRKQEGESASDDLIFSAPILNCTGNGPCVSVKIFYVDGSPSYGFEIPRDKTEFSIPWSVLLKGNKFLLGDRGFWGYQYTMKFIDESGTQRETTTQGEIYMRVIKKGYMPLHDIKDDPNFVWQINDGITTVKMTSSGRTYVSGGK